MNTDNNRRFQETDERILRAFGKLSLKKSIDRVTVSDVCREAGIHRTTFYGHYQDVVQLRKIVEQYPARMVFERMREEQNWNVRDAFLELTRFFFRNQDAIRRSLTAGRAESALPQFLPDRWDDEKDEKYLRFFHSGTPEEAEYHRTYYEAGVQAVLQKWLNEGCRETPEEITEYLGRIVGF